MGVLLLKFYDDDDHDHDDDDDDDNNDDEILENNFSVNVLYSKKQEKRGENGAKEVRERTYKRSNHRMLITFSSDMEIIIIAPITRC